MRLGRTHIFGCGVALEVRLDRLVLLVELGQIRDKVLDDVGVRKGVDAALSLGVGGDTAWMMVSGWPMSRQM